MLQPLWLLHPLRCCYPLGASCIAVRMLPLSPSSKALLAPDRRTTRTGKLQTSWQTLGPGSARSADEDARIRRRGAPNPVRGMEPCRNASRWPRADSLCKPLKKHRPPTLLLASLAGDEAIVENDLVPTGYDQPPLPCPLLCCSRPLCWCCSFSGVHDLTIDGHEPVLHHLDLDAHGSD